MPEEGKITIISSQHCPGCKDLEKTIKELGIKNITTLIIEKSNKALYLANSLDISAVPMAVIKGKKYRISQDGSCLVFQSKGKKIKVCKKA